ncbi:HEXXH motif domain-containing protein [Parafrankia sp. FMc2]|uniref:HEXXH motif domain-containing protein n=1 Tax=Parafrankia sp. FMc2 TaxID=3233196 RepID=UPI0034D5C7CE
MTPGPPGGTGSTFGPGSAFGTGTGSRPGRIGGSADRPAGTHVLARAEFDILAAGAGGTDGVLRDAQLSRRVLLLRAVVDSAAERGTPLQAELRHALALLSDAQRRDRAAVQSVLLSPNIGAWATHCLSRLRRSGPPEEDLAYLVGLAAAAAIRAGLDFEVTVRPTRAGVMFPTLGRADLPPGTGEVRVRHRGGSGSLELAGLETIAVGDATGNDTRVWRPLRLLSSTAGGERISVLLDDLDPYRGHQGLPVAGRLSRAEVADWQARLDEAWLLLTHGHQARAMAIARGVAAFVPLRATASAPELSASSRDAFGAVALTCPTDGITLAGALVHEFQHAKLSALLDLVPLHGRSGGELFYAPWRSDPRPVRGLLQGAYAYLGLCDFWQVHRASAGAPGARLAEFEFARWRDQVRRTLPTLAASGELTPEGSRFIGGMERQAAELCRAVVPDRPAAFARIASADHRTTWRLRNLRPEPETVAARADAWLAGRACPAVPPVPARVITGRPAFHMTGRIRLARLAVTEPEQFDQVRHNPGALAALAPPATVADARYVSGDAAGAARAYRDELVRDPARIDAWTGLALACRDLPDPAGSGLTDGGLTGSRLTGGGPLDAAPEEVLALAGEITSRSGSAPDPLGLAAWLAAGTAPPASAG